MVTQIHTRNRDAEWGGGWEVGCGGIIEQKNFSSVGEKRESSCSC